ncbi:MAG: NAD/NADP octopine/nopaline dehydrogenase family protein [bacterium]|nr:NAD/NADP octopine/nopaline dehydrogenase family protein [bacterium]
MKVAIAGGGNIGTQFAVHFAEKGHSVYIHTSKPEKFSRILSIVDYHDNVIHQAKIKKATSSDKEAFQNADLIFVTVPSFAMQNAAKQIIPYAKKGTMIGIIPGNGGGELAFEAALSKGVILFGLQRVPSVARLVEYGKKVRATGYRQKLYVAALPKKSTGKIKNIISKNFDMICDILPDYLNLTLTPSNPILHTSRLFTLFKDYIPGKTYKKVPLFYQEWNNETTELLFKCDDEVQRLCQSLNKFDLSDVKSLKVHYENTTIKGFTHKIQSIEGFKGLPTPTIKVGDRFIPDLRSRYFTADFNYGLNIFIQIARMYEVDMPNCLKILEWYSRIRDTNFNEFNFINYGIKNKNELERFYQK